MRAERVKEVADMIYRSKGLGREEIGKMIEGAVGDRVAIKRAVAEVQRRNRARNHVLRAEDGESEDVMSSEEMEQILSEEFSRQAPSASSDYAALADEIERTIFFREIDVVETDTIALKRQIANLVRSKTFRQAPSVSHPVPASQPVREEEERKAFEADLWREFPDMARIRTMRSQLNGDYIDTDVKRRFEGWLARARGGKK